MKTQKELHESALSLLSLIKAAEGQRTEMLRYNVEVAEPNGFRTYTDEELLFKCAVISRLKRSYNNILKELVTKSMEQ